MRRLLSAATDTNLVARPLISRTKASRKGPSGNLLWLGWGDLAIKCASAFSAARTAGYRIHALDVVEEPAAMKKGVLPDEFYLRRSAERNAKLKQVGRTEGFDAIYVGNQGNQHISSAIEFQDYTSALIVAKPLDTDLFLLLNILNDSDQYIHFVPKLFVHDHYLNKPGVTFLANLIPTLHEQHNFINGIKLFLCERCTIESREAHRVKSLNCGMLFDLGVHLISMLALLVPRRLKWHYDGLGTYERTKLSIDVTACSTGKYAGSLLQKSTVIHGWEAETFGALELRVTEWIHHESGQEIVREFPVLVVVSKGVAGEQGMARDLKTVVLSFEEEAQITLDLDTYGFSGIDDATLRDAKYDKLSFNQRGINLPLISAIQSRFDFAHSNPFQLHLPAIESVRLLYEGLRMASPRPIGHRAPGTTCREILNGFLRQNQRFSQWKLPDNFGNFLIGTPLITDVWA